MQQTPLLAWVQFLLSAPSSPVLLELRFCFLEAEPFCSAPLKVADAHLELHQVFSSECGATSPILFSHFPMQTTV